MLTVTRILSACGLTGDISQVPEYALVRGSAVHMTIALELQNGEDYFKAFDVHADVVPYLESWRQWSRSVGYVHGASEVEVQGYGYIGHADLLGTINGVEYVLDLKCGAPAKWHALQLAGYAAAIGGNRKRGGVYLSGEGSPATFVPYDDPLDFGVFSAAVTVASWKAKSK